MLLRSPPRLTGGHEKKDQEKGEENNKVEYEKGRKKKAQT